MRKREIDKLLQAYEKTVVEAFRYIMQVESRNIALQATIKTYRGMLGIPLED